MTGPPRTKRDSFSSTSARGPIGRSLVFAAGLHLLALAPLAWATQHLLLGSPAESEAKVQISLRPRAPQTHAKAPGVEPERVAPAPIEPAPPPSIIPPADPPPPTVPQGPLALHVPSPTPTVWNTPAHPEEPQPSKPTSTEPSQPPPPAVATPPNAKPVVATRARVRRRVQPDYPTRCRRRGHAGVARVLVLIGVDGAPRRVTLTRSAGCERLDAEALAAVRDYRFHAATLEGRRVTSSESIEVRFQPRS